jgi:hypothetical protein
MVDYDGGPVVGAVAGADWVCCVHVGRQYIERVVNLRARLRFPGTGGNEQ